VKRKDGLRRPSISPPTTTQEVEHTKAEARMHAASTYSMSATIGPSLLWSHEKRVNKNEQKTKRATCETRATNGN
jgi:hypothetical protein